MVSKSQKHKNAILDCIAKMDGITEDRFGNYIMPGGRRYHPKKTALNKQVKAVRGWVNVWSAYYKDLAITDDGRLSVIKTIR